MHSACESNWIPEQLPVTRVQMPEFEPPAPAPEALQAVEIGLLLSYPFSHRMRVRLPTDVLNFVGSCVFTGSSGGRRASQKLAITEENSVNSKDAKRNALSIIHYNSKAYFLRKVSKFKCRSDGLQI